MCEPMTIAAVTAGTASLVGGVAGVVGAVQTGNYEAAVARNNARVARWQELDARRRGGEAVGEIRAEAAQMKGTGLAEAGASGVEATSGSMANMFAAGDAAAAQDVEKAKYNAALEAWGYRNEAEEQKQKAKLAKRQSILGAFGAGLGGLGGALNAYADYRRG